jgi:splicing factor 3B subunit 3
MSDSFHLLKYKPRENQFVEIADDVLPRWITSAAILDYHTLVGADKFENLFVCRLPDSIDEEINEDFFTYKFKWEAGYLNGAACKFEQICSFFYGEVATTILKTTLTPTSKEVIFFTTSMGSMGVLYPFESKEVIVFF